MRKFTTFILLFLALKPVYAQNADICLLQSINAQSSPFLRTYSNVISQTTYAAAVAVPVVMGTVALIQGDNQLLESTFCVGGSLVIGEALAFGLKYIVGRERPYERYPDLIDVIQTSSSPSFPSGHTSVAFAAATALTLEYPRWYVAAPCYFWACSVGYSRMNLGVHYPSDVLAGALLGAASACVTHIVNKRLWEKREPKEIIWY